jgi:hypothetical protein
VATFYEALKELNRLKDEQLVWFEVVEYLSKFVDREGVSAGASIASETANGVPQAVIADVIKAVNKEKIAVLYDQIDRFSMVNVNLSGTQGTISSRPPMEASNGNENQNQAKDSKAQAVVKKGQGVIAKPGSRPARVVRKAPQPSQPAQPGPAGDTEQHAADK